MTAHHSQDSAAYTVEMVCHKIMGRFQNAKEDKDILNLPTCTRCLATGPEQPLPQPPWLSDAAARPP